MDTLSVLLYVGAGLILLVVGIAIGFAWDRTVSRMRLRSIKTADDHWDEARHLLHEAIRTNDKAYERYLRDMAYHHCQVAEKMLHSSTPTAPVPAHRMEVD